VQKVGKADVVSEAVNQLMTATIPKVITHLQQFQYPCYPLILKQPCVPPATCIAWRSSSCVHVGRWKLLTMFSWQQNNSGGQSGCS